MTKAIEEIPTMTPTQMLVELLRRDEVTNWQKADAMKQAVEDGWDDPRDSSDPAHLKTGLYARIDEVWQEVVEDDGIAEKPSIATMAAWYNVAVSWPDETRHEGASYMAHYRLMGPKWPHRQGILSKLVARKKKGILNEADVRRWKQEQEARDPFVPWEDRLYKRLNSVVHSDSLGIQDADEMRQAIKILNTLTEDLRRELEEMEEDDA